METRVIDGAYVDVDFGGLSLLANVCVNGEPAFSVTGLSFDFDSEIPTDILEKYVFKYLDKYGEPGEEQRLVTLDGALLWASRVPGVGRWVDYIKSEVVPNAKNLYESLLMSRQRHLAMVDEASAKVARHERKVAEWKERRDRSAKSIAEINARLHLEPA